MKDIVMWTLVSVMVLSVFATVAIIGKPRKPIDNNAAIATIIINGLMIAATLYIGGAL